MSAQKDPRDRPAVPSREERRQIAQGLRQEIGAGTVDAGVALFRRYFLPGPGKWPGPGITVDDVKREVREGLGGARHAVYLAIRETPLVFAVLLVVFLSAESWQFFGRLQADRYWATLAAFVVVLFVALLFGLRREWIDSYSAVAKQPSKAAAPEHQEKEEQALLKRMSAPTAPITVPAISRWVVGFLELTRLAAYAFAVGVAAMAFFVAFGAVAIDADLTRSWSLRQGEHIYVAVNDAKDVFGLSLLVSDELVRVGSMLGAFAALNFTVGVITETRIKDEIVIPRFRKYESAIRTWACLYYGNARERSERPFALAPSLAE